MCVLRVLGIGGVELEPMRQLVIRQMHAFHLAPPLPSHRLGLQLRTLQAELTAHPFHAGVEENSSLLRKSSDPRLNVSVAAVQDQFVEMLAPDVDVAVGTPPTAKHHQVSTSVVATNRELVTAHLLARRLDDVERVRLEHVLVPPGTNADDVPFLDLLHDTIGAVEDVPVLTAHTELHRGLRRG